MTCETLDTSDKQQTKSDEMFATISMDSNGQKEI